MRSVVSSRGVPSAAIARSASRPMKSPGFVQLDDVVQPHLEGVGLVREVVDVREQQPRLDAQRLDRRETDRADPVRRTGTQHRVPQLGGILRRAVELEAELSRVSGARNPAGDTADPRRLSQEAEVAQRREVGAFGDRAEHLARLRPLDLEVGHLRRAVLDLHLERAICGDGAKPVEVGVVAGDREAVIVGHAKDRAVHDHLALLVAHRAVAHLADRQRGHVVGEEDVRRAPARHGRAGPTCAAATRPTCWRRCGSRRARPPRHRSRQPTPTPPSRSSSRQPPAEPHRTPYASAQPCSSPL